jgi:hypothetical protein
MVKLLENTFRAVNIGLVNELALMCDKMNIDVWEVVDAAKTKPFGFMAFYPGPGLGGHCIPIDPFYLSWKAKQTGFDPRFIELAGHINAGMPHYVVEKVAEALNMKRKAVNGSNILIAGVAYKRDIDDMRESPALDVMGLLHGKGAKVSYADPYVPEVHGREWSGRYDIKAVDPTRARSANDCAGSPPITRFLTTRPSIAEGPVIRHAQRDRKLIRTWFALALRSRSPRALAPSCRSRALARTRTMRCACAGSVFWFSAFAIGCTTGYHFPRCGRGWAHGQSTKRISAALNGFHFRHQPRGTGARLPGRLTPSCSSTTPPAEVVVSDGR